MTGFDQLTEISLETRADTRHNWAAIPRLVRADVERTLEAAPWLTGSASCWSRRRSGYRPRPRSIRGRSMRRRFVSPAVSRPRCGAIRLSPATPICATWRSRRCRSPPPGEPDPEEIYSILDQHVGVQLAAINRLIIEQARSRRMVEHFGPSRGRFRGSVITTLRGGADQIVPRLALAGAGPGADEYEFIVVVTNADQFEPALRAARVAEATLGLSLTLVLRARRRSRRHG